ncbi:MULTISPECIES: molecular chaperone [unclassified Colwellia]|uniref:molecular chaperone n=1 Tax=unclassified Colwellia TaxID=196834 RepID=UPI0015F45FD9|nr:MULTISPECIES: molecular chaperone [unclassified Colwellia]MBA6230956.1 molecular chaperone [Colwellia sp. MB02u-7]MBA6234887.1 molecular chaperone [Colwellia sp. MB02u-11]MBA6255751.1 molecular chaperone [Colwellia sp. MB3u-28]MBA6261892.1 molecular chaperone [Colwellia sp. MB3u-41]MBA6301442.1 molecular chaperone [Colwellia sp. MB3u-22]
MIGFDYGTSNCAVAVMENGQPKILSLGEHGKYIPSTLYAPSRDIIAHWLCQQLNEEQQPLFKEQRALPLRKGQNVLRELKLDGIPSDLSFGQAALNLYLEDPEEGYYIKSPKSFLGASGLVESQVNLFEDIVAAMMSNIKTLAEENQQKEITQAVIGRPINFQGLKGEESNRQALTILSNAAKRVGYKSVEFQYEPVAAGFEYEASLQEETKVLVVDIGGGTTDCSMLLMGPKFKDSASREQHLLAHTGVRIGGNDFDIQLALKGIMPSLGMNDTLKTGKPMPVNSFNQAVAINNINEQTNFYSQANYRYLQTLQRDAQQPDVFSRLLKVHQQKLSHRIVNGAEQAKIGLTEHDSQQIYLDDLAGNLKVEVSRALMLTASSAQLKQIALLMNECVVQANCQPDVIFVTGGSAKSPVLNQFLRDQMPNTPLIVGDHFGSVTVGLARWAEKVFQ